MFLKFGRIRISAPQEGVGGMRGGFVENGGGFFCGDALDDYAMCTSCRCLYLAPLNVV